MHTRGMGRPNVVQVSSGGAHNKCVLVRFNWREVYKPYSYYEAMYIHAGEVTAGECICDSMDRFEKSKRRIFDWQ